MNLFVMLNLGLGDAILCNGLCRELSKDHDKIFLPCYAHNARSVRFMFSDLLNVQVQEIYDANDIFNLQRQHESVNNKILRLGCYSESNPLEPETFDQTFYRQAGIDFECRWESFKLPEILNPVKSEEGIAFICEDKERGFNINHEMILSTLPKFYPSKSDTIFDYVPLLYLAEEVHTIDTSFLHLIESIPVKGSLFYHAYARASGQYHQAKKRKAWITFT